MEFLRLLFAPCKEISRRTSLSLDQPIPRSHHVAIRIHYLYCTACRRYRRQIRFIRDALRRFETGAVPEEAFVELSLPADARTRLQRFVENQ